MTDPNEEPKIIVDDDWKEQVQKEKTDAAVDKETDNSLPELPPASFSILVSTLSTQALASMGYIPDPNGQPMTNLPMAKHFVDTLAVLEEKTKGNLDNEESSLLTETLHQLRMAFVQTSNPTDPPPSQAGSTIELP